MRTFAIPAAWFLGVLAASLSGFRPDPYLEHVRQLPPPHPYPIATVLWVVLFMSVHSAIAYVVLRPASYSLSWGRALFAFALSLAFLALGVVGGMHAPNPWYVYLLWLFVAVLATLVLSLWSIIGAARRAGT